MQFFDTLINDLPRQRIRKYFPYPYFTLYNGLEAWNVPPISKITAYSYDNIFCLVLRSQLGHFQGSIINAIETSLNKISR